MADIRELSWMGFDLVGFIAYFSPSIGPLARVLEHACKFLRDEDLRPDVKNLMPCSSQVLQPYRTTFNLSILILILVVVNPGFAIF